MSNVTDVVFVASYGPDAERAAQIASEHYWNGEHTPTPLDDSGPRTSGATVYNFGFNYAEETLLEAFRTEKWHGHTVLWIHSEHRDGPEIWVDGTRIRATTFEY